jgi:hypothetical protein
MYSTLMTRAELYCCKKQQEWLWSHGDYPMFAVLQIVSHSLLISYGMLACCHQPSRGLAGSSTSISSSDLSHNMAQQTWCPY